jgi:uncharacterized alkaline shock family protein YloU
VNFFANTSLRWTERRRDNRREMRREKRTKGIKVKSSEEQNIPVDGGANNHTS